ncbi:MAG: 2-oxo acid dehydrogenase subunit E2 [Verrucomicrobia bacterium]|nr:2-oxo acid dehydrogenase subunit E2 [Verrucomicrobiota bacterium]
MAKEITMPALSPSMTEGVLAKWHKKVGDTIKPGEVIAEVETDKATMDLEAFDKGTLLAIAAPEGSKVAVNGRIAVIGEPGEKVEAVSAPAPTKPAPSPATTTASSSVPVSAPAPVPVPTSSSGRVKASPLAKKIAAEKGVDLSRLAGSGPGGRIVRKDVEGTPGGGARPAASLFGGKPIAQDSTRPVSQMRAAIARRLVESKTMAPHFYVEREADAAPLGRLRASANEALELAKANLKLTVTDFVLKATVEALRRVPAVNSSWEGSAIRQHGSVHLAFAVALPDGLITPVIRNAHAKDLRTIAREAKELGAKAKAGKLQPEEYTGGTFTVSNLGMVGVERFAAILNPPQAAILAVGATVKKPVLASNGAVIPGERMSLTVSADHRVVDGLLAGEFLKALVELLENPGVLLL